MTSSLIALLKVGVLAWPTAQNTESIRHYANDDHVLVARDFWCLGDMRLCLLTEVYGVAQPCQWQAKDMSY